MPPPKPSRLKDGASQQAAIKQKVATDERRTPVLLVGVTGNYQLLGEQPRPHHYGGGAIGLSLRLAGPLRLAVTVGAVGGGVATDGHGNTLSQFSDTTGGGSILPTLAVGPRLWFHTGSPVHPHVGAFFRVAPNAPAGTTGGDGGLPVLPGGGGEFGLDFRLGAAPLLIGPFAEVGVLGPYFSLQGGLRLRFSVG